MSTKLEDHVVYGLFRAVLHQMLNLSLSLQSSSVILLTEKSEQIDSLGVVAVVTSKRGSSIAYLYDHHFIHATRSLDAIETEAFLFAWSSRCSCHADPTDELLLNKLLAKHGNWGLVSGVFVKKLQVVC